jgi:hypothetical protein
VAAPSLAQPLLSLKENTTPHPANKKQVSKSRHPAQQFSFGKTFCLLQTFTPLIYNVLKIFLENFMQERKL